MASQTPCGGLQLRVPMGRVETGPGISPVSSPPVLAGSGRSGLPGPGLGVRVAVCFHEVYGGAPSWGAVSLRAGLCWSPDAPALLRKGRLQALRSGLGRPGPSPALGCVKGFPWQRPVILCPQRLQEWGQVTEPKVRDGAQARPGLSLIGERRSSSPGVGESGSHAELCTDPQTWLCSYCVRGGGPGLWSGELCGEA